MIQNIPILDSRLLSRALTHRSYLNEHEEALEDNERLEFLGDAVLDFLVGAWLYQHYPEMAEGELTQMRSALVRTEQLAEFARELDLGSMMKLGKGEGDAGGRERPALLCATFEAVIGALYLDSNIDSVHQFIEPMLEVAAEEIIAARKERDPKSIFQEWVQAEGFGTPNYKTISSIGPEHAKQFEVEVWVGNKFYGRGSGKSKRLAAKAAASDALKNLGLDR